MKIGLLSRNANLYSTSRLKEAAEERGHDVRVVDYLRCVMDITSHKPAIRYGGQELSPLDAVIPRIGATHTFYGTAVVRQFEMMNVFPTNESQGISRSRDKLRSLQLLSRNGIGLPVTGIAHSTKDIDGLIDLVGGAPLIVKLIEGTQGVGVVLAETKKAAESVIAAFRQLDANILVQEFIKEAKGADIRAFVIGGRVVASMRRQGAPGEFRSNLHQGGHAEKIKLTPEERSTAVRAAKTMGLNVCGVDLLRSNHGPVVMEVNSSPGLEGIEQTTGIDVAGKVIEFIEKNARPGNTPDLGPGLNVSGTVHVEAVGTTTVVTIDRPDVRNAVDGPTALALHDAFLAFDADDGQAVAILTGASGTFCAGADLKAVSTGDGNRVEAMTAGAPDPEALGPMGPTRLRLSKPVIAAVEGHAVAGGLELALWCDLRVAARDATFGVYCRRWGVPLIDGGTVRLPRLIGQSRALDMILSGRPVEGPEAEAWGLANRLTKPGGALDGALALAEQLAAFPQHCLRSDRASALDQWSRSEWDALAHETELGLATIRSGETLEGASRFAAGEGRHGQF